MSMTPSSSNPDITEIISHTPFQGTCEEDTTMKHLCAIIRKPQEGKTFICLENIVSRPDCYHLIITMNTIKSNLQFFQRAKARFGDKICVFNSREKKKDQNPNFLHAKDVTGVKKHLARGVNVVIMCAHHKRFDESILDLLMEIQDSRRIQKPTVIHIDEAHAYVPAYRDQVIEMNESDVTERIYMYSATPFALWADEGSTSRTEQLFKNIFVVDCEKDFSVKATDKYFGVKDCKVVTVPQGHYKMITPYIPDDFILRYGDERQKDEVRKGVRQVWYGTNSKGAPFNLGDEVVLLSHTGYTLRHLKKCGKIKNDAFSYNFVPGFVRKLTHYSLMENILETFPRALVIVINGNGSQLYRLDGDTDGALPMWEELAPKNEPSEQIEDAIKRYPGRPTFITGFHCVGMSVTFINPRIGNFDHVIYSHGHYNSSPDILYQLCRFLFNYTDSKTWNADAVAKIKKTRIYVTSMSIIQHCLDYEKQIDKISQEMTGSMRTKGEVVGSVKIKKKKLPKEKEFDALLPFAKCEVQKVTVDEGDCEEEEFNKMKKVYEEWTGKELKGKALPEKNENGFYECSTTKKKKVFTEPKELKKEILGWKATSNFALTANNYRYARIYVAYDDEGDSKEYVWFIRKMEITRCEEVDSFWATKQLQ